MNPYLVAILALTGMALLGANDRMDFWPSMIFGAILMLAVLAILRGAYGPIGTGSNQTPDDGSDGRERPETAADEANASAVTTARATTWFICPGCGAWNFKGCWRCVCGKSLVIPPPSAGRREA